MTFAVWVLVFCIFIYTAGFAYKLWKGKNKIGACAVLLLAVLIVFVQIFSDFA
ncbi:hypothetical protein EV282_2854 [Fictibacillus sp. BK138]|nr:hypothetical protein EV282_2854 [Fictibacillus sp. BK138]